MRVSDAERRHVADQLQQAMANGQLTPTEFTERTESALASRTRRELDAVISDLPVQPPPYAGAVAGGSAEPVELRANFGSVKRRGRWQVPRALLLRGRMTSYELDFSEAENPNPVVEVELDVSGGSVEVRLPEGAGVDTDGVEVTLGSVEDHRRDAPAHGSPHFVFSGALRFGSLEVRGPRRKWFGR